MAIGSFSGAECNTKKSIQKNNKDKEAEKYCSKSEMRRKP